MKTYVITLSKVFPATHPLKGEPTGFREAFRKNKLHTIRANYPLWKKRIAEVQRGSCSLRGIMYKTKSNIYLIHKKQ